LVAGCAVPAAVSSASGGQGVAAITTDGQTSTIDGETSDSSPATGTIARVDPALILHSSVVNPTVGARLDPAPEGSTAVPVDIAKAELERRFGPLASAFKPSLVVMRVAMVFQWLRAARQSPSNRAACLSYAVSIAAAQIGWVALIFLHVRPLLFLALAVVLAVPEMAGPVVAENKRPTPWHAHHIAERYSLLAIIALGEGIVGTTAALGAVIQAGGGWTWQVAAVGFAGMGVTFGMWWTYFTMPSAEVLHIFRSAKAFAWATGICRSSCPSRRPAPACM